MIPTQIQLVLRTIKGSELTWKEGDDNFTRLRTAILGLAETVGAGRVVFGPEPPLGERAGVLWIPTTGELGAFRWDSGASKWVRVTDPVLWGTTGGTGAAYTLTLGRTFPDYAALTGYPIPFKASVASADDATMNINSLGAKNLKTVISSGLTNIKANELVANGIYMAIYDGNDLVVVNPTAIEKVTGPVFITPVTVYGPLAAAVTWADFDASGSVPDGAKAVILQGTARWNNAADGQCHIEIRKDIAGNVYELVEAAGTDAVETTCQGIFPCASDRKFQYQVTETIGASGLATIKLIGYIL